MWGPGGVCAGAGGVQRCGGAPGGGGERGELADAVAADIGCGRASAGGTDVDGRGVGGGGGRGDDRGAAGAVGGSGTWTSGGRDSRGAGENYEDRRQDRG